MRVSGERVKVTRFVETEKYVVAVDVEAVYPEGDPSEPCFESEVVQLMRQVLEHAERGDEAWLRQHGRLYVAAGAA